VTKAKTQALHTPIGQLLIRCYDIIIYFDPLTLPFMTSTPSQTNIAVEANLCPRLWNEKRRPPWKESHRTTATTENRTATTRAALGRWLPLVSLLLLLLTPAEKTRVEKRRAPWNEETRRTPPPSDDSKTPSTPQTPATAPRLHYMCSLCYGCLQEAPW